MKVKFLPQNIECEIKPGQTVLHVAQDNGIYVKSVCRGVPSCAECRVRVVEGDHNVTPPASAELGLIGTGHFIDHRRLSCQLRCFGDITVDLTEQVEKEAKIKSGLDKARPNNREESLSQSGMYGSILAETVSKVGDAQIDQELKKEEQEIKARENNQRRNPNQQRNQQNQNQNPNQKQNQKQTQNRNPNQGGPPKQGGPKQGGSRNRRGNQRRGSGGGGGAGPQGGPSSGPSGGSKPNPNSGNRS